MKRTPEDYQKMFLGLQPPGLAWSRRLQSNWAKLWGAGGDGFARLEEELHRLIREINPLYADALLEDWEAVTGLPDECTEPGEGKESRRAAVIAKLQRPGGQSIEFFLKFLAPFGDKIEIEEGYPPFLSEVSAAYDRTWELETGIMFDENGGTYRDWYHGWAFVWTVIRTNHKGRRFRAGREGAGDPLVIWNVNAGEADANLECRINQLKPAHTVVMFEYKLDNAG
jgi:uncharacterized protein YmfQ (DUF2313 family)